jgi:hypothetical protein
MLAIRKDKALDEVFPGVFSFCGAVPKTEKPLVDALLNDDNSSNADDDEVVLVYQAQNLLREVPDELNSDEDKANLWRAMILRLCAKASIVKARASALDALRDASKYFLGKAMSLSI